MTIQLMLGDCLIEMPKLPDKSVDCILTDLPYGTTACSWDVIIPFEPMWAQVKRILKPRGVFVTTASQPFTSKLVMSNLEWFKYEWIWEKDRATRHLDANRRPLNAHENILIFGNEGTDYKPQKLKGCTPGHKTSSKSLGSLGESLRGGFRPSNEFMEGYIPSERFPRTVIKYNMANNGEFGAHPTQKPVALYAYLIRTYTNEGDMVLDMCMGSGTTLVACIQTGRNGIGIELREDYYKIAQARVAEAQLQMRMAI